MIKIIKEFGRESIGLNKQEIDYINEKSEKIQQDYQDYLDNLNSTHKAGTISDEDYFEKYFASVNSLHNEECERRSFIDKSLARIAEILASAFFLAGAYIYSKTNSMNSENK